MFRTGILFLLCFGFMHAVRSQDTLPGVKVTLLGGKKALVSWINPYNNITSINIQRSGDSVRNFKSIGSVLNVGAQENGFVDQKEFLPNEQYYRLFITFEGGDYLFTKARQPVIDTTSQKETVKEKLPEVKEVEKEKEVAVAKPKVEKKPAPPPIRLFVPSAFVHTGKDQNVIISLPGAEHKRYTIKFYEDDGTFLFELKKIPESHLTMDKANFNHSGLFRYELFDTGILKEAHKFYIPKAGKPMPVLDENGYEIKK